MKDIEIKISKETRMVDLSKTVIGNDSENLQGNLVFSFTDEFIDGTARLEYQINNENGYIMLLKQDETYYIPIKSILTKQGQINMQLVITEGTSEEEMPIFKSNVFYMICNKSINAEIEAPDEYAQWIDIANTKLNELDKKIKEIDTIETDIDEATFKNYVREQDELFIGKETQLDFNAILENNEIIANLDESIKDYELQNNTGYLFHIYLPLVTLTGDLDNNYPIYLMDKDFNKININCIFQKDINKTSTVGDMCQIQDYDIGIGYSWEFYGHFRKITENDKEINVIYTDTVVRETNPSMTGEQLHLAVSDNKLKVGTSVLCLSNYENNGTTYKKGHTYLIENESEDEEIILIATDMTEEVLKGINNYDKNKIQVLKNMNGEFIWIDE